MIDLEQLAEKEGFRFVRRRKHAVYRHPDGRTFVLPSTPSDWRANRNNLSWLARLTGKSKQELLGAQQKTKPNETPTIFTVEPVVEIAIKPPEPEILHPEKPLTKNEQKKLKRWAKHYAEREQRLARLKIHLEDLMLRVTEVVERKNMATTMITYGLWNLLTEERRNPKYIGLGICDQIYVTLQCGPFYLDLVNHLARTETTWYQEGVAIEVLGELSEDDIYG